MSFFSLFLYKSFARKSLEVDFELEASDLQRKAAERFCQVLSLKNVPLFLFLTSGRTCLEIRRHR